MFFDYLIFSGYIRLGTNMEAQRIHVGERVWGAERLRSRPRAKAEAKHMTIDCG